MRRAAVLALALLAALPARGEAVYRLPADPVAARFVASNLVAVFYHELGHALIDVLMLPVLGSEEDAADTLAALFITRLRQGAEAEALVADTALGFRLYGQEADRNGRDESYWGLHSLDAAREASLVCLFYGADPETRAGIAARLGLPAAQRDDCREDFTGAAARWDALLAVRPPQDGGRGLRLAVPADRDDLTRLIAFEIAAVNAEFGLPRWVDVSVERCGEANAFYDLRARRIVMCIEYAEDLARLFESRPGP